MEQTMTFTEQDKLKALAIVNIFETSRPFGDYLEELKRLTDWETAPALTEDDLEASLAAAALEDINGLAPLHEEWIPTYELNAAAAHAWLIKAARAAATIASSDARSRP